MSIASNGSSRGAVQPRRRLSNDRRYATAYGHAERNLALIRQLGAETRRLLPGLDQPDAEHSAWLQENAAGTTAADDRATTQWDNR